MLTALALTLLTVEPATPTPPPLPSSASPEAVAAPATEPVEVRAFAQFVDRHLLTVDYALGTFTAFKVRQRERTASLNDEDFSALFRAVPEAEQVAQRAHDNFRTALMFQFAGLGLTLSALVPALLIGIVPGGAIAMVAITAGLMLSGLVLTLIAAPQASSAMSDMFSAVSLHNRSLLERRPVSTTSGTRVDAAFRDGLAYALPH